jgi:hypothetical protein
MPRHDGRCLIEVAAIPTFLSPFHWRLIAQLSDGYELVDISLVDSGIREDAGAGDRAARRGAAFPNHWTPAATLAASAHVAQVFLGFSRFPAVRSFRESDGTAVVQWTDMRFSAASGGRPRGARGSLFTATVRVSPDGNVIEEKLGE